jgi:thioesterase domain-containing protein
VAGLAEVLGRLALPWEQLLKAATDGQLAALRADPVVARLLPPGLAAAGPTRPLRVYLGNALALRRYAPVPVPVPLRVVLYRAAAPARPDDDPTLGWAAVARGGVTVRAVAGDHYSLMRPPHVAGLAGALRADLEAASGDRVH